MMKTQPGPFVPSRIVHHNGVLANLSGSRAPHRLTDQITARMSEGSGSTLRRSTRCLPPRYPSACLWLG